MSDELSDRMDGGPSGRMDGGPSGRAEAELSGRADGGLSGRADAGLSERADAERYERADAERSERADAELSVVLREFAAAAEQGTRPVLTGAQVRGRAVRRARRRIAGTLGAAAVALALVGFALTRDFTGQEDGHGHRLPGPAAQADPSPSPSPSPSSPTSPSPSLSPSVTAGAVATPVPVVPTTGTLDLAKRALSVGDRVMPLTSDSSNSPTFVGPLTVYGKYDTKVLTVTDSTTRVGLYTEVSLAVELRDARNQPVYVGIARSYKGKALGTRATPAVDGSGAGWLGLDAADAKWFYQEAKTGSALSVTGGGS